MNYRHIYHAGNFADVMKHWILTLLLEKLREKPTPFGVLDTHAGIGFYDLSSAHAQKTGEYQEGINKLVSAPHIPATFDTYLQIIEACQAGAKGLQFYPGSPYITQQALREEDQLIACELHPEEFNTLQLNLIPNKNSLALHQQDAYLAMKAFLPLKQNRGLVLIDPPFEKEHEFNTIIAALTLALHRFAHGMYAIWYPIKHRPPVKSFHKKIQSLNLNKVLVAELFIQDDVSAATLNGCGMLFINPPWQLEATLRENLPWLAQLFKKNRGARADIFTL